MGRRSGRAAAEALQQARRALTSGCGGISAGIGVVIPAATPPATVPSARLMRAESAFAASCPPRMAALPFISFANLDARCNSSTHFLVSASFCAYTKNSFSSVEKRNPSWRCALHTLSGTCAGLPVTESGQRSASFTCGAGHMGRGEVSRPLLRWAPLRVSKDQYRGRGRNAAARRRGERTRNAPRHRDSSAASAEASSS